MKREHLKMEIMLTIEIRTLILISSSVVSVQTSTVHPVVACGSVVPATFISSGRTVMINFVSSQVSSGTHHGFSLKYKIACKSSNFTYRYNTKLLRLSFAKLGSVAQLVECSPQTLLKKTI